MQGRRRAFEPFPSFEETSQTCREKIQETNGIARDVNWILANRLISCWWDVQAFVCASFDLVGERLRALGVIPPSKAHPCRGYAGNDQSGQRAGQSHGLEQQEFRREVQQSNHKRRQRGT